MAIAVTCAGCKRTFKTPEKNAGSFIRCHYCGNETRVGPGTFAAPPKAEQAADAAAPTAALEPGAPPPPVGPDAPPSAVPAAASSAPAVGQDEILDAVVARTRPCLACGERIPHDVPACPFCGRGASLEPRVAPEIIFEIARFRAQARMLGGIWVVYAIWHVAQTLREISEARQTFVTDEQFYGMMRLLGYGFGGAWLVFGAVTFARRLWGAYCGAAVTGVWLAITGLTALNNQGAGLCNAVAAFVALVYSLVVIGQGRRVVAAGYATTTRPEDL